MDILVLSPCSDSKLYDETDLDDEIPDCAAVDQYSRETLVREYSEFVAPAAEMYTGDEHQAVKRGVDNLREIANVDWNIISAGFGLLHDDTEIPTYDCGFSDIESVRTRATRAGHNVESLTNDETIQSVGREKRIPQDFRQTMNRGYDLLFVVLSEPYLLAVTEALAEIPEETTAFAFASKGSKQYIGDCQWIPATETERKALETTWMRLRGNLFETLTLEADAESLRNISGHPSVLQESGMWRD